MGKSIDPKDLALGVAELFGVDLDVEEGSFVDPDEGLANVRITARFEVLEVEGTFYAQDLEEAARKVVLVVAAQYLPDEDDYDDLELAE